MVVIRCGVTCQASTVEPKVHLLPLKAGERGVRTSKVANRSRINSEAGWHARMSSRLADKGACACGLLQVLIIRLRPPPRNGLGAAPAGPASPNGGDGVNKLIVIRLAAALLACCQVSTSMAQGTAHREVGQQPKADVDSVVTVGSPLLRQFNMIVVPGMVLTRDVDVDLGFVGSIRMSAGSAMRVVTDTPSKLRACSVAADTYVNGSDQRSACLTDTGHHGSFDTVSADSIIGSKRALSDPIPYTLDRVPENYGANNHQSVLIYLGAAGGVLRLSYREFSNDMARPAYTEDLTFPITGTYPQTVTWRDTKITLLGLSDGGLRYRVEPAK